MSDYLEKFEKMRVAGNLAAKTLDMLTDNIKEGVTTDYIDKLGYEFIRDHGGYSAPLYYRGFKKSLCTSLNHVICHGVPSDRVLRDGDALNVDVTAIIDDHYGDTSRMYCIGNTSVKINNLIDDTSNAYNHLGRTKLAYIVDSGCSAHYIKSEDATYYPNKTEQSYVHVQLPNGATMSSNSTLYHKYRIKERRLMCSRT